MIKRVLSGKNKEYILVASFLVMITVGNYYLSGGAKSNWIKASDYGFSILYPPGANFWSTGLDDDLVFDLSGRYAASSEKGMIGFNKGDQEFGLIWVTLEDSLSFEELVDIHYHSGEVNAIKRDRGFKLETQSMTYESVNGHKAAFQAHIFELDMPDMDQPLYGKGVVAGWTCGETGVSYVVYTYFWNSRFPSVKSYDKIQNTLEKYLETLECH
jgi:hypothetical protein